MNALEIERMCYAILKDEPRNAPLKWYRHYFRKADSYAVSYCPGLFKLLDRVAAKMATMKED